MCSGPLAKVLHWGPLTALGIIKLITFVTLHNINLWLIGDSWLFFINNSIFLMWAGLTLYHFLEAMWQGPGFLPKGWRLENEADTQCLQQCKVCNGYKAPRSHHCRKCNRCVKQMDHHCPWINSCVGWANHRSFTLFLLFAVIGCLHAAVILVYCIYVALVVRRSRVHITLYWLSFTLLAVGFAIGIVLAVGLLFYFQMRGIIRNRTSIEDWIMEKCRVRRLLANEKPLKYPYDLGWRRNLSECFRGPTGDGISWPLADGCGPYDLTLEQLCQKEEKRSRTRHFVVKSSLRGSFCPLWSHPRAAVSFPCDLETRLALPKDSRIGVTRYTSHWLYGEVVSCNGGGNRRRGWVPRAACLLIPSEHED